MRITGALLVIALLFVSLGGLGGCRTTGGVAPGEVRVRRRPPVPMPEQVRAIWVARYHYYSPEDVRAVIRNCAALGCNTVLWQVRGEGTVGYPSRIEPWSREYAFRDPGFDPLAIAVEAAHKHGLRIEAYVNVMPGWKGRKPPPVRSQLHYTHPEWFLRDESGRRQPLGDFYVVLNPCWPEVRRHIASVVEEIVARYDVDGVHLDYVRYAWDGTKDARKRYPRDSRTLALYRRDTGRHPDDDPRAWNAWRANQLTRLVDDIRTAVDRSRPGATLTAAVWRNPQLGYRDYLQNGVAWLRAGLVDALMPMAYTTKLERLTADIESYRRLVGKRRVVPGLGIYLHEEPGQMRGQVQQCMRWGGDFALFSYASLFPTPGDARSKAAQREAAERMRASRRAVLGDYR